MEREIIERTQCRRVGKLPISRQEIEIEMVGDDEGDEHGG
jgi:hypothetical protein